MSPKTRKAPRTKSAPGARTTGKAHSLREELKSKGAIIVKGRKEALSILKTPKK